MELLRVRMQRWALVLLLSFSVVLTSPVGHGVTAEDMDMDDKLDSKAMQGLLKKLWKYEAETWKAKYEGAENRSILLEQRVRELLTELDKCKGAETAPEVQTEPEGHWSEDVVTEDDVGVEDTEDQTVEDDLRSLTGESEGPTERDGETYDTEFVIMPPQERSTADSGDDYIRITSPQDDDVSVHVIEPRDAKQVAYRIPPHGVIQIPLNRIPKGENANIQLAADQPVKVQILTQGNSPADGYNVIFVSTLGTDYTLKEEDESARFAIVSMADDTDVKMQDSSGKMVYSVLLQQGQTFLTPAGNGPSFAGGSISAQNPVAAFSVSPTQCNNNQECSARTLQLLQPNKLDRKAWNDCLISSSGCKKKRPRPG